MGLWTDPSLVRKIAGISDDEMTDPEIIEFIDLAQKEVNSKISIKVTREPVYLIDSYRSNKIDGSNTTFFIKNWKDNYLADLNYDNEVTTSDVRVFAYNPSTQTETELTVSSIDINAGSFTLSSAPSNLQLWVTYAYTNFDPVNPHPLVSQCVAYLAASYPLIGEDGFKVRFGNVHLEPSSDAGGKGEQLLAKYQSLLDQLGLNSNLGADWSDMAIKI